MQHGTRTVRQDMMEYMRMYVLGRYSIAVLMGTGIHVYIPVASVVFVWFRRSASSMGGG